MSPKTVHALEEELGEAMAAAVRRLGSDALPLIPSPHTLEMMAKAATAVYEAAVYEAAVDNRGPRPT